MPKKLPEVGVTFSIISGYDFRVADKNVRLREFARGRGLGMSGVLADMGQADDTKRSFVEKKIGPHLAYGDRAEDEFTLKLQFDVAYKTGKQFTFTLNGPVAAMKKHEPALYDWLAKFQFLP